MTTSRPSRFRYGLSVVIASIVSEIRMIRAPSGICFPDKPERITLAIPSLVMMPNAVLDETPKLRNDTD